MLSSVKVHFIHVQHNFDHSDLQKRVKRQFFLFSVRQYQRLGYPYDDCREGWNNKEFTVYSQFGMEVFCEFKLALEHCGCIVGNYYIPDDLSCSQFCYNHNLSKYEMEKRIDCAITFCDEILRNETICKSIWPCKENVYNTLLSHSSWPDVNSTMSVVENLVLHSSFHVSENCTRMLNLIDESDFSQQYKNFSFTPIESHNASLEGRNTMCIPYMGLLEALDIPPDQALNKTFVTICMQKLYAETTDIKTLKRRQKLANWVMNQFLKLNVFLPDNKVEVLKQYPKVQFVDCLAAIGGSMGLWIGWSLLTAFEVVSLFVSILKILIRRVFNDRN